MVHIEGIGQVQIKAIKSELAQRKDMTDAGRIQDSQDTQAPRRGMAELNRRWKTAPRAGG